MRIAQMQFFANFINAHEFKQHVMKSHLNANQFSVGV